MGDGREEGTCYDEHRVLYVSEKSLDSTPETKTALYVNYLKCKLEKKKHSVGPNLYIVRTSQIILGAEFEYSD